MGKALIIKNVNFNTNKLTTVTIMTEVPCTSISLDESTLSLTAVGAQATLTPTITPSNCTDTVSWSSSDTSVATVNSGIVTETGIGTATITATCGSYTATCTVTTVNTLQLEYILGQYLHGMKYESSAHDYVYIEGNNVPAYAAVCSTTPTTKRLWHNTESTAGAAAYRYPYMLGNGASTVTITAPSTVRVTHWFTGSTIPCDYSLTSAPAAAYAKELGGSRSAYDSQVALGSRTISTIPENADSICFNVQYPNNTVTDEIMSNITIVIS